MNNGKEIPGKMFQILGYDMMIDEDLKVWLLEINDHPSLNIYLEKDWMGGGVPKTLSLIDEYVKKTCVGDTIRLVKKKKEKVKQL